MSHPPTPFTSHQTTPHRRNKTIQAQENGVHRQRETRHNFSLVFQARGTHSPTPSFYDVSYPPPSFTTHQTTTHRRNKTIQAQENGVHRQRETRHDFSLVFQVRGMHSPTLCFYGVSYPPPPFTAHQTTPHMRNKTKQTQENGVQRQRETRHDFSLVFQVRGTHSRAPVFYALPLQSLSPTATLELPNSHTRNAVRAQTQLLCWPAQLLCSGQNLGVIQLGLKAKNLTEGTILFGLLVGALGGAYIFV